jgi:tetratricopeptide (TPR) repeat protein
MSREALSCFDEYEELLTQKKTDYEWTKKDADFWLKRGKAYIELGDSNSLSKGEKALNKAVELDSTMTRAFENLAYAYYKQGNYQRAIPFFLKTLQLDSTNFNAYLYLAYCYISLDRYADAVEPLKKALELKPDDLQVVKTLAKIYSFNNRFQEAIPYYEKALEADPSDCDMQGGLGYSYMRSDKPELALSHLRKVVDCKPNSVDYMLLLARALESTSEMKEALKWYEDVLRLDPKSKVAEDGKDRVLMQMPAKE